MRGGSVNVRDAFAAKGPRPVQHGGGVESDISASRLESTDDRSKRCSCHKRDLGDPSPNTVGRVQRFNDAIA
jgi:hypothetical protein